MTADDRVRALLDTLGGQFDAGALLVNGQVSGSYAEDAMGRGVRPPVVLRPGSTEGVAAMLAAADSLRQPLVIQGGRTGLSGAARPLAGEVSMSLERMTGILALDAQAQTITVLAGTPLQIVQEAALDAGLYFGVDIGARGTSAIGGNIATNAGGIRVLRYGMFRAQVAGLEVVLADGSILSSLKGLPKDNSGYDLNPLFIGTEGTLGVITKACLKLHPKPKGERNALLALPSLSAAQALLSRLRGEIGGLISAFEIIFPDVYAETVGYMKLRPPVPVGSGLYAVVEIQGQAPEEDDARLEAALGAAIEDGLVEDAVLSSSGREFDEIWAIRDGINDYLFSLGAMENYDLAVPVSRIEEFVARAETAVADIDRSARAFLFGHLGDGNLHYCVITEQAKSVSKAVYEAVASVGGGITAEHGIGTDKVAYLKLSRSDAEIAAMRRLKAAFDPNGILNAGRVFAAE
ncbi:MAG: FAD-binding oxidoreductase [Neorhizobium sp.]|nr:FAD-binding oxidoreductase [Neorhizobium sp.]